MAGQNNFWSNPGLEPKRQYRWVFSFGRATGNEEGLLPSYICRKVDKPTFNITETEHTFLNHKFYYPGRVEWQEVSLTIVDPLGIDAANALQRIVEEAGYVNPSNLTVGTAGPGKAPQGKLQTISKANFASENGVIGQAYIQQLDAAGSIRETWTLNNAWIKSVDFGSLDYTADELVEITLQLRYDWATQTQGSPTT